MMREKCCFYLCILFCFFASERSYITIFIAAFYSHKYWKRQTNNKNHHRKPAIGENSKSSTLKYIRKRSIDVELYQPSRDKCIANAHIEHETTEKERNTEQWKAMKKQNTHIITTTAIISI